MRTIKYYSYTLVIYFLVIISICSFIMALTIGYDIIVIVGQVDGDMFSSDWNEIYNFTDIDYDNMGFVIGMSLIFLFILPAVASRLAIDFYWERHNLKQPGSGEKK